MGSTQIALYGNGLMPQALEQLSRPMRREASRQIEQIVINGLIENTYEQARACVASSVLQNAGALSELAEHLSKVAPSGTARYQHIVDAYTLSAARTISRW